MDFRALLGFLKELNQNNSKDWMDGNRSRYRALRHDFIQWLDHLDMELARLDPDYYPTPGKTGMNRINNNLMFHPDKPVYKDHFGAGLDKAPKTADFYIEIGLKGPFLAGGLWRPEPARLNRIRAAIDYDGEVLEGILQKPTFKEMFGGLYEDQRLKRMPKGYSADHPHAALLKLKTYAVVRSLPAASIFQDDFEDRIFETYFEMLPFRRYLNQALSVPS